jgi:putative holliday junction resolvase
MRYLGIDPGDVRIGLAVSDDTGLIAGPAGVVLHTARAADAAAILRRAQELGAVKIVMGVAYDPEGQPSPSGRKAIRLAEELRSQSALEVVYVDEYGTTNQAQQAARDLGLGRKQREKEGHRDAIAAVILLQSYLDTLPRES